jgi:actin-related protein
MTGRQVNIYLQEKNYNAVRQIVGPRQISRYINQALEEKLQKEQLSSEVQLEKQLVRGYQAMAKNKKLQEELAFWDETLGDSDK